MVFTSTGWNALTKTEPGLIAFDDEPRPEFYAMYARLAIQKKADFARELAVAEREAEVEAKAQTLDDPEKFWAYIEAERPVYADKTRAVLKWRGCRKHADQALFDELFAGGEVVNVDDREIEDDAE